MSDAPPPVGPKAPLQRPPAEVRAAADYARIAAEHMSPALLAHVEGGSGQDRTASYNLSAFADFAILPRLLRSVRNGHTGCTVGDVERPHPIMLAPIGWQGLLHPEAERASAMAAAATQSAFIASTMSSLTLEEIASSAGSDRWFQLYFQPEHAANEDLDTPLQLPSHRAVAAGWRAPEGLAANLAAYPPAPPVEIGADDSVILNGMMARAPTLADIDWLVQRSSLPVWVKGVLHPNDAIDLAGRGVEGLIVSNHGGRSLDGAPASLDMLAAVRERVGAAIPLLFDGGIRSGCDIFKAIALGADAVLVGRLQAYALAVAGAVGVGHMIRLLREELEACMALAGCATIDDIRGAELVA